MSAKDEELDKITRIATRLTNDESSFASIQKISGGLTNINYKVRINKQAYFIRFGSHLNELLGSSIEMEWNCSKIASDAGIAPKTILYVPEERVLVTDFIETHGNNISLKDPNFLDKFSKLLKRLHSIKDAFPQRFCPFETIHAYAKNAIDQGADLPVAVFDTLLPLIDKLKPMLESPSELVPCHLDLHLGNVLDDGEKMWLIDWEYAAMSDPYFDLATFAATENLSNRDMLLLLKSYMGEKEPTVKDFSRLYYLRIIADARWALWSYLQAMISPIDQAFAPYGDLFLYRSLTRIGEVFP